MNARACPWAAAVLIALLAAACGGDTDGTVLPDGADVLAEVDGGDTGTLPDADAEGPDAEADADGVASPYGPGQPPAAPAPISLQAQTWRQHWIDDVRPFWVMAEALGSPAGNYPTYRGMDGSVQSPSERRPRMISRQVYAYAMGYLLTGEEALLDHAHAGVRWLLDHARDQARGGWHALLDAAGDPLGDGPKLAQDTAYCLLGLAAWFFVTRDAEAEAALLVGRDLLFDPALYWDATNRRIRDGLTADLSGEVDAEADGGWELVAQLDALNGFLALAQPVLSDAARREQWLADMRVLSQTLIDTFWDDGIFWGVHTKIGQYKTRHVDFGHTLKSYWMVLQTDKRLPDHPFAPWLAEHVDVWIRKALDRSNGRWGKRPTTASGGIEYGSDWWIYAEADQLAATVSLQDWRWADDLAETAGHWISDYVDRSRAAREVVPSIKRDGSWVWDWTDGDTAKCNQWKSGYHATEHALVMYLVASAREGAPASLHFAVPAADATFTARPYVFEGREVAREDLGAVDVGGTALRHVRVDFADLW